MSDKVNILEKMLEKQLELQIEHMGGDPRELRGTERADFIRTMTLALEDELHEAMAETKWKPWTTDRGSVDIEPFNKEMVDAWHFFMNLLLVGNPTKSCEEIAIDFVDGYFKKNEVNAQRQIDGYTGDKCPQCHRETEEAQVVTVDPATNTVYLKCSCGTSYTTTQKDIIK